MSENFDVKEEQEKEVKAILYHKERQTKLDDIYPTQADNIAIKEY